MSKDHSLNIMKQEDRDKISSSKPISKSTLIAEIVDSYPDAIPIMIENGMHCIGCGASMFETLEEGFLGHGMDEGEMDRVLDEMNKFIKKNSKK